MFPPRQPRSTSTAPATPSRLTSSRLTPSRPSSRVRPRRAIPHILRDTSAATVPPAFFPPESSASSSSAPTSSPADTKPWVFTPTTPSVSTTPSSMPLSTSPSGPTPPTPTTLAWPSAKPTPTPTTFTWATASASASSQAPADDPLNTLPRLKPRKRLAMSPYGYGRRLYCGHHIERNTWRGPSLFPAAKERERDVAATVGRATLFPTLVAPPARDGLHHSDEVAAHGHN